MITGVILTHNEERNIVACIEHLRPHVGEIILVDTESTDRTRELARPLVNRILPHPHVPNFDSARNLAIPAAKFDWMWFVDADEHVTDLTGQLVNRWIREQGDKFEAITDSVQVVFLRPVDAPLWLVARLHDAARSQAGPFPLLDRLHGGVEPTAGRFACRPIQSWESTIQLSQRRTLPRKAQSLHIDRGAVRLRTEVPSGTGEALREMVRDLWMYYEYNPGTSTASGAGFCRGSRGSTAGWRGPS